MLDVLIVDDDPKTRRALREILEPLKHSVSEARNGREALRLVERSEPDLIIVDILMPEMDGLETIRYLRRKGYHMPIIAMPTGKHMMANRYTEFARSFGADDVLLKPFEPAEVLKVLRRTVGQGSSPGDSNSSATG